MNWDIRPYRGLGPLNLGMTRAEVAALDHLIGTPTDETIGYDGSLNEYRTMDMPVCNYAEGRLIAIDTNHRVRNVLFGDLDIYRAEPIEVLTKLSAASGGAHVGLGDVIFFGIGVNTGGFYDAANASAATLDGLATSQDNRGLALFARGAFDDLKKDYKSIRTFD